MADLNHTQFFRVEAEPEDSVKKILEEVYDALTEKGYNPVDCGIYYVRRSYLYYQPQECQKYYYEGRT